MSRVLVTNDDGIDALGVHALAGALARAGHDVLVVAPDGDHSGTGASLGMLSFGDHIPVRRVELPDLPAVEAWAIAGPPGLTVLTAYLEAFGPPPAFVVSGINAGPNTGRAILHSGTVGAALTAQNFGMSGLAVSLVAPADGEPWAWDGAGDLAVQVFERFLVDAPSRSVLNLNVPAEPPASLDGVRWARLAPFGTVRAAVAGTNDPTAGRLQFELRSTGDVPAPDTDSGVIAAGLASLTAIVGVVEAWPAPDDGGDHGVEERAVPGAPVAPVHRVPDASAHGVLRRALHE